MTTSLYTKATQFLRSRLAFSTFSVISCKVLRSWVIAVGSFHHSGDIHLTASGDGLQGGIWRITSSVLISIQKGMVGWGAWYIIPEQRAKQRLIGLMRRYPSRKLIPFAKRDDCDDIACFEVDRPNFVEIIHDFSSPGFEQRQEYTSFKQWISINYRIIFGVATPPIVCWKR